METVTLTVHQGFLMYNIWWMLQYVLWSCLCMSFTLTSSVMFLFSSTLLFCMLASLLYVGALCSLGQTASCPQIQEGKLLRLRVVPYSHCKFKPSPAPLLPPFPTSTQTHWSPTGTITNPRLTQSCTSSELPVVITVISFQSNVTLLVTNCLDCAGSRA